MKCLKLYGKHDLKNEIIEDPVINEEQVLIRVKSVGICRSDIHYYSFGETGGIKIDSPLILGHEFSGEIIEVGKCVQSFDKGDRVAIDPSVSCEKCEFCLRGDPNLCPDVKFNGTPPIMGALSEFYAASKSQLFKIPDSFSFDDGALLEPLGVGIHSCRLAKIREHQNIAILGAGSIGLLVLQLLKKYKIKNISVFDIRENKIEFAKKYNVDLALKINDNCLEYQSELAANFSKFDVVFETAGANDAVDISMKLAKPGAKIVMVGIAPNEKISINSTEYRRKGLSLIGVRRMKNTYPEAIELVKNNIIDFKGIITHRFPIELGACAFDLVENYKDKVIKAIINP